MNVIDLVKNYLTYEGYQPEVDQDGDIHFRCQGLHLYCTNSGKDQQYLRLLLPNIYQVENNRTKVLEVSNQLSKEYKVLKSFLVDDSLWLAIEIFIDSTPEVGDFMGRCINILTSARLDAFRYLNE